MKDVVEIDSCQLCGHKGLTTYLNLGFSPLANSLKKTADEVEFEAPLEVVKCENKECECFQLRHLVNPEILFSNYSYRSSYGLKSHFEEYAKTTSEFLRLEKGDFIVGIGGNTGLLEDEYQKLGFFDVINVEPAKNIAKEAEENGVTTFNSFFGPEVTYSFFNDYQFNFAKLITCNNCWAHTDLKPLIHGIKILLDKEGYLVIENAYWLNSVQNLDIFQCYHEHKFYHHIKGLKNFFDIHGFDLFKVTYNSVQCGSFRIFVKWKENTKFEIDKSVEEAIKNEEEFGLYKKKTYNNLLDELDNLSAEIHVELKKIRDSGKTIGLFGIAAKTVLMLKYFGIADYISFATDDSDLKWNRFIPGTNIKITNKEEFWAQKPDYVIPIYNFFDDIVKANKDRDCKWVRILPKLEIL